MAIDVLGVRYNGGLLLDSIDTFDSKCDFEIL